MPSLPTNAMFTYGHLLARLSDAFSIYVSGMVAFYAYFGYGLWSWERYHWMVSLGALLGMMIFSGIGTYRSWRGSSHVALSSRLLRGYLMLAMLIMVYLYLAKNGQGFSRLWFALWLSGAFIGSMSIRIAAYWVLQSLRLKGHYLKQVVLIGTQEACRELYRAIRRDMAVGFVVSQIRLIDAEQANFAMVEDVARFDAKRDATLNAHEIWLCAPLTEGEMIEQIMDCLRYSTANIRLIPDLRGIRLINHKSSYVVGHYALDLSVTPMSGTQRLIKALEDKLIAGLALLLCSPIFLVAALWILCVSGRPIFYRQERVGWNGKSFTILKFRSMPNHHEMNGVVWGQAQSKKTILGGRFLRRFCIDELPQFWNVFKGDMSVVGPRPERSEFVEQFKHEIPGYMQKHLVKAGLTGWAQVHGWRGDTDLQQRINHDLWYIENWSLWLDIKIIFMTVISVLTDKNNA